MNKGLEDLTRVSVQTKPKVAAQSFLFLRHGETAGNHKRVYQDRDSQLNATGVAQAQRAAETLAAQKIDRIFASDMPRAWRTAEIVSARLKLPVTKWEKLRERWFGDLVGTSSVGLDWSVDPPNGETLVAFVTRTIAGLESALTSDTPTLLVAHGGNLRVIAAALGIVLNPSFIANATPLRFTCAAGKWAITPLQPVGGAAVADGSVS